MDQNEEKELNPGCCGDIKPVAVVGCGDPHLDAVTVLQLSWDVSTEPAKTSILVWLVNKDGSKQEINPSDISVAPGLTLEEYINRELRGKGQREYMRDSLKDISESFIQKAPPPSKNRDHQQEKYRRRYHGRKK